jgi:flagellar basal body-associated protein FliL
MISHLNKIIIGVVVVVLLAVAFAYVDIDLSKQLDKGIATELNEKSDAERVESKKTLPTPNAGAAVK